MNAPLRVVIVTHKRPDLLARTLGYLSACRLPESFAGAIVVENGGKFGAESVVNEASKGLRLTYHYEPEASKSRALNDAVALSRDAFLVFIDDDVRVDPGFLFAYADAAGRFGPGRFFGGPLLIDAEKEPPEWLKAYLPSSVRGWSLSAFTDDITKPTFAGGNWAAWASDLIEAGGFDERLGPEETRAVGEDTAMQAALLRAGAVGVYVPDALLWHYVPKERCTPRWALRRAYRHAFRDGYTFLDETPRLFGYPKWMIGEGIRRFFKAVWGGWTRDPESAFRLWLDYWKLRGLMSGIKRARSVPAPSHAGDASAHPADAFAARPLPAAHAANPCSVSSSGEVGRE